MKLREGAPSPGGIVQQQIEVWKRQTEETQRQTEIQQRPFAIIYGYEYNDLDIIESNNIGNGIAINIRVKYVNFKLNSINSNVIWDISILILISHKTKEVYLTHIVERNDSATEEHIKMVRRNLNTAIAIVETEIIIEFKNINNQLDFVKEKL